MVCIGASCYLPHCLILLHCLNTPLHTHRSRSTSSADPPASLVEFTTGHRRTWRIPLHSQQATWRDYLLELRPQERWLHWPPCPHSPTSCPQQQVELTVHRAKKTLRVQAVITDVNPKKLVATCSSSLDFEGKAKIGCSENSNGTENPPSIQQTSLQS